MYLLLPPSETKTRGGRGRPLRARIDAGPLGAARVRAIDALSVLVGDPAAAARALLLPEGGVDQALADDATILDSPTTPALRRYAGTVYAGLALSTLGAAEQRVVARCTFVFSGLFGVVRGDEAVPAYRVPAKAVLPGLGVAATYWRPILDRTLPLVLRRSGLVVDLRSSDYAAMWRPPRDMAARVLTVRVLSPLPRGGHGVISYNSKHAKGRLAAALARRVAAGSTVETVDDVAAGWLDAGGVDAVIDGRRLDLHTA